MSLSKFSASVACALVAGSCLGQTTRNVPSQFATIQGAINVSLSGDTISVAPGTYSGAINYLGKNLVVVSSGGPSVTTLTAAGGRVVTFQSGESAAAKLQGFKVTGSSGGLSIVGASPQIIDCTFVNCFAMGASNCLTPGCNSGGGAYVATLGSGTTAPTFQGCTFQNCYATSQGGGIYAETASVSGSNAGLLSLAVVGCRFVNCATVSQQSSNFGSGGGVKVRMQSSQSSVATFADCSFEGCFATNGGGVLVEGSSSTMSGGVTFTQCAFLGNVAALSTGGGGQGAATYVQGVNLTANGCFLAGNHAEFDSALVVSLSLNPAFHSATLISCTIAGNTTGMATSGLSFSGGGPVSLINCIVNGNSGLDLYSSIPLTTSHCNIGFGTYAPAPSDVSGDPRFVDPQNGDFHLAPTSPLKNAGTSATALLPFDMDGHPRVVGSAPDIGADEIPVLGMPGTGEDVDLFVWKNGGGDPLATTLSGATNDVLRILLRSPTGAFVGAPPVVAGMVFVSSVQPILIPGLSLYLDGSFFIIAGSVSAAPFGTPGLTPDGLELFLQAPAGLAGLTFRVQGAVTGGPAINGVYALTSAHDVVF